MGGLYLFWRTSLTNCEWLIPGTGRMVLMCTFAIPGVGPGQGLDACPFLAGRVRKAERAVRRKFYSLSLGWSDG
jgi:hypothetical protein